MRKRGVIPPRITRKIAMCRKSNGSGCGRTGGGGNARVLTPIPEPAYSTLTLMCRYFRSAGLHQRVLAQ
jgi:hypothetical protein